MLEEFEKQAFPVLYGGFIVLYRNNDVHHVI
ncbi:hypothetical protein HmCmsJML007_00109 [Escherichia coli]|nr:hypothetical protein HmCmsJML007_00109 [Escherichia coli]